MSTPMSTPMSTSCQRRRRRSCTAPSCTECSRGGNGTAADPLDLAQRRGIAVEQLDWAFVNPNTGESAVEALCRRGQSALALRLYQDHFPRINPARKSRGTRSFVGHYVALDDAHSLQLLLQHPSFQGRVTQAGLCPNGGAGTTLLDFAVRHDAVRCAALLLGLGADRNEGCPGFEALAARCSSARMLEVLLDDGFEDEAILDVDEEMRLGAAPVPLDDSATADRGAASSRKEDKVVVDASDAAADDDDAEFPALTAARPPAASSSAQQARELDRRAFSSSRLAVVAGEPHLLCNAIRLGEPALVQRLLDRGASVDGVGVLCAIDKATGGNGKKKTMMEFLLERCGADANSLDASGLTLAHRLSERLRPDELPLIRCLAEHGANLHAVPDAGLKSVLEHARSKLPYRYEDPWSDEEDPEMDFLDAMGGLEREFPEPAFSHVKSASKR